MFFNKKNIIIFLALLGLLLTLFLCFAKVKTEEATAEKKPAKYMILIDVESSRLYLFQDKVCIKQYLVATGKYSTPTPLGYYKIIHKDTWGEGFGGRWMGFNVPWGTLILEYERG